MKRSLYADAFNEIANDPDVRPWLGFGRGAIDLAPVVGDPRNFCFLTPGGHGGYVMHRLADGLYEAHTLSHPGKSAVPMARLRNDVLDYIFTATDCVEITTKVPDQHPTAEAWASAAGFNKAFRREGGFVLDDLEVGFSVYSLSYQRWALWSRHLDKAGQWFHDMLKGAGAANHPDDPDHDRWVGATIEACRGGQAYKGVVLYNRWALQAGYAPVTLLSTAPVVVDVGDAVVHLIDGRMEVLRGA